MDSVCEHQEVSEYERQYPDGSDPRLLDIIDIPLLEHRPQGYQDGPPAEPHHIFLVPNCPTVGVRLTKREKRMAMSTVTIEVPDIIPESHRKDANKIKKNAQYGFIIWEYLNGHLSLHECGIFLQTGYRGFLELLWSKGIPIDGLSDTDIEQQLVAIRRVMDKQ